MFTLFPCRVLLYNHTAIGCILMFWMGEVTSPLLNVFTFSRELRHTSKVAFRVFQISSPLFTGDPDAGQTALRVMTACRVRAGGS